MSERVFHIFTPIVNTNRVIMGSANHLEIHQDTVFSKIIIADLVLTDDLDNQVTVTADSQSQSSSSKRKER